MRKTTKNVWEIQLKILLQNFVAAVFHGKYDKIQKKITRKSNFLLQIKIKNFQLRWALIFEKCGKPEIEKWRKNGQKLKKQ